MSANTKNGRKPKKLSAVTIAKLRVGNAHGDMVYLFDRVQRGTMSAQDARRRMHLAAANLKVSEEVLTQEERLAKAKSRPAKAK